MAKEKIELKVIKGDSENSMIFIMLQTIKGQSAYFVAKITENFCKRETKVLQMAVEQHLRKILRENECSPESGSMQDLAKAMSKLEFKGKTICIYDRYADIKNEKIVGESDDGTITVINENGVLSAAVEVEVVDL